MVQIHFCIFMSKLTIDDLNTYIENTKERRRKIKELILDKNNTLVSLDEFEKKLNKNMVL